MVSPDVTPPLHFFVGSKICTYIYIVQFSLNLFDVTPDKKAFIIVHEKIRDPKKTTKAKNGCFTIN